jgi:hypothetical protein
MTTDITVYWDDRMLDHEPPKGAFKFPDTPIVAVPEVHPDRRERVENIRAMVAHAFGDRSETVSPESASRAALERVHDPEYLDWLIEFCADGGGRIDDRIERAHVRRRPRLGWGCNRRCWARARPGGTR